jgi:hypothetical protein
LTVEATVAPELVADLADLLRRVTGRAASDETGAIAVSLAPGVSPSDAERDLRTVLQRWSDMHPGIRVRVTLDGRLSQSSRRWRPVAASALEGGRSRRTKSC